MGPDPGGDIENIFCLRSDESGQAADTLHPYPSAYSRPAVRVRIAGPVHLKITLKWLKSGHFRRRAPRPGRTHWPSHCGLKESTNCAERALLWPSRSGLQTSKSLRRTRNHHFLTLVALAGTCGRPCSTIRHTRMNTLGVALLATTPLTLVAYDPVTRVKPRGPQCQRPGQPCRAPAPPPPQAPRPRPPGQPSRAPAVPGSRHPCLAVAYHGVPPCCVCTNVPAVPTAGPTLSGSRTAAPAVHAAPAPGPTLSGSRGAGFHLLARPRPATLGAVPPLSSVLPIRQQLHRNLWRRALRARADGRAVDAHVWQGASVLLIRQQLQNLSSLATSGVASPATTAEPLVSCSSGSSSLALMAAL